MKGLSETLYQAFLERAYRLGYTTVEYESKCPLFINKKHPIFCFLPVV